MSDKRTEEKIALEFINELEGKLENENLMEHFDLLRRRIKGPKVSRRLIREKMKQVLDNGPIEFYFHGDVVIADLFREAGVKVED